jgi:PAS domain S-box-containing protein
LTCRPALVTVFFREDDVSRNKDKPEGRFTQELGLLRDRLQRLRQESDTSLDAQLLSELDRRDLLARIIDTSPVGITVVDIKGNIIFANKQAENILGLTRETITSLTYDAPQWRITDWEGRPLAADLLPFNRVLRTRAAVSDIQHAIQWPDGTQVMLAINGSPLFNQDMELDGVVFSINDITERMRSQEQLSEKASRLARSNAELEQFASVVSHELQEPLRAVTGFLQLLKRRNAQSLDQESLSYVERTIAAASRMQSLIGDILDFARIDTTGTPRQAVDMNLAASRALEPLQDVIDQTRAVITIEDLPTVPGDPDQLERVFRNLVSNALKYQGQDPPDIRISVRETDDGAVFSVADNGLGIEPRHYERIFMIFKRLHSMQEYSGTGIGLAICKKIVERHNGELWVESTPGQGSTFSFLLPRLRGARP